MPIDPPRARATALRVIREEARALDALAEGLGDGFETAVETILGARGRVVVSGMGKSGHVGRKIAATLASTGTPAQFVHPAEASHGDLGMMMRGDVVLVLSNSGETPELADLVAHTRRFGIPLIGVAGRAGSSLLRRSDVALLLPAVPEACGIGVVPTTSTAMMLALGDALAIALMEARAFTPEDFRGFHPGGRLGARLTRVAALMHGGAAVPLVAEGAPMGEALLEMSRKGFGVVGVTDAGGRLVGIVTDGDLRRHMAGLLDRTAGEVMTRRPLTVAPDALAEEAVALMNARRVTCLFVVDPAEPGRVAGVLHVHDCLRAGLG
ncbi:KpsF/GutQ family sugar-phosphate isomerase [Rubellimicrobium aerolatum]|uniref:SIS domain-containing protein n=1 Tax=Rubellimicrobium aerolatum TaxID=490979 RepID=A0ABW0SAE2_9RHOB|nr:KpsF/GutQ family sugar-phosphate isomerase [Rubellimicrobium aerolatum]MBP1805224.1 arabinose-5-phosphate isomerase [Rubellimicrobium aerolatum]